AYTLGAEDLLSVTVYDGTTIYNLDASEFTVAGGIVTLTGLNAAHATTRDVQLVLTVASPMFHSAADVKRYTGAPTDYVVAGTPLLDAQGNLQFDKDGHLIVYTASQTVKTYVERFFYDPDSGTVSGSPQTIKLTTAPINSNVSIVIDGRTLSASEWTYLD